MIKTLIPICLMLQFVATAAPNLPPDSAYVQVSESGTLLQNGERVRFWGAVLNYMPARSKAFDFEPEDGPEERGRKLEARRAAIDATAERLAGLGFNLVRSWDTFDPTQPYEAGDGSPQDLFAYTCHAFEQRGISLWIPQFNNIGNISEDDVDVIDSPEDAQAWRLALREWNAEKTKSIRGSKFSVHDPRTAALRLQRMKAYADFPNHYKGGLRLADDPQVVVWELSNEEWWFTSMLNGAWQGYPKFFRDQMMAAWHEFLLKKYTDNEGLRQAWGFLLEGESLDEASVLLAPLARPVREVVLNDVNPHAIDAQTARKQTFTRDDFTRQRGADVIEFLLKTVIAHKQVERDAVKSWGKSAALSPLVFDTGDGFRIQTVYLHQLADAVTMCTYLEGFAKDPQEPRFPWFSYLDEPPRMAHDVPWAEIGRVPGKPFFLYETQAMNPSKYRAEFPYRLLALSAIQDWDIVLWHCFPRPVVATDDAPYSRALEVGHGGFPAEGFHFRYDEVQSAAMKTAATVFRQGGLKTVENPTTFVFGKDLLYDPASMDYGGSFGDYGDKLAPTAFRHGLHMSVDPNAETTTVTGPLVLSRVHEGNPIRSTSEIEWDWRKSHLKIDAPGAALYTGFFAQHGGPLTFDSGVTLSEVRVHNPDDAPYPVGEAERFIAFGLASTDGRPLAESQRLEMTLVSTSFNRGAFYDPANVARGKQWEGEKKGTAPVQVSRVTATVQADFLHGKTYRFLDWHFREIGQGIVEENGLQIPADLPVFLVQFESNAE
ncbi:MAG: hypothetical protein WD490_08820 [Opitutales bacterium]